MSAGFKGFPRFNGVSGFSGFSGFNGFSGYSEGGVPIPLNALLYYAFFQNNLDNAETEQVGKVNTVYTERASNINIEQTLSGQVVTYAAGVAAFDRGQNMQVWDGATNLTVNSGLVGTGGSNGAPDSWSGFTLGGTRVQVPSTVFSSATAIEFSAVSERPFIQAAAQPITTGEFYAGSAVIEEADGIVVAQGTLGGFVSAGAAITVTYPICEANPSGGGSGVVVEGELLIGIEVTATGEGSLRFGIGSSGNATGNIRMSQPQLELNNKTPFILTPVGAPATRAPTASSISTFTTPAYWIDSPIDGGEVNPVFLSGRSDGDWTGGVNLVVQRFDVSNNIVTPKLAGLCTAQLIGSVWSVGSNSVKITSVPSTSIVGWVLISGSASAFESQALITVDYTQSAYFTGSLAADSLAVFNDRVAAGDLTGDLNALGVPALIPVTDIVIACKFKFFSAPSDFHKALISGLTDSVDGWVIERNQGANRWIFINRDVGLSASSTPDTLNEGDTVEMELEVSSSTGTALIINGVRGTSNASITSLPTWLIGRIVLMQQLNGARPTNAGVEELTVRPI